MTDIERWTAVQNNDRSYDGVFYYAVNSTGIFCRPSCVSRPPKWENVRFFLSRESALQSGFRPCKRCRPDLIVYQPEMETAARAMAVLKTCYADREALESGLDTLGLSRRRLSECFRAAYGVTLGQCLEALRLDAAGVLLTEEPKLPVVQAAFAVGYGSLSAFYRGFRRSTGLSPVQYREKKQKEESI